jgi:hypothetical protein
MDASRISELTDDELDTYIQARLKMAGVDLSVLPEDDSSAPADRKGILESARRFLRSTPAAILAFEPDVQRVPPVLYPAALSVPLRVEEREESDAR